MRRLVYVSLSRVGTDDDEIRGIAQVSLARNSQHGVTGFLYYDEEIFLQVLEGMEEDVESIYASIRRDARHEEVVTLGSERTEGRQFGGWSMGFLDGSLESTSRPLGRSFHREAQTLELSRVVRMLLNMTQEYQSVRLV